MAEALIDAVVDSIKILPILYLTYLLMEFIEDKASDKINGTIKKAGKAGPLIGGIFGLIPQCGFSAAASSLYAARVITVGTLVAIFLSTSDEMLPILISSSVGAGEIAKILVLKLCIGVICGFIVDFFARGKRRNMDIHAICEKDHCECENGNIFLSALKHTVNITVLIFLVLLALNMIIEYAGEDALASFIGNRPVIGPLTAAVVGLIPNCSSSVIITNLYAQGVLGFGTMMSGLLVNSGIGLLVLFKMNDDVKENLKITGVLFVISVICGIVIDLF